jgi:hypothetical protein
MLLLACVVLTHIGFIFLDYFMLFGVNIFMFHFLLKIQNLHIGPRPKNSIYSGGQTAWQDPEEKEKNLNRLFQNFGMDGLDEELKKWLANYL